ncbi:hypothetical protein N7516_007952 [Penicillium verrucosum]|uniref:uncharacterized protein n=1 Tax=Penicillium verrucosum TaxID=60171 RepID=UPI0025457497|nr:uncharacterized protein N7516_007952 [Penicillium verrucosum]KAJ5926179.1 hypothetical protein N7516_007952 [Penicillium verrucosum]
MSQGPGRRIKAAQLNPIQSNPINPNESCEAKFAGGGSGATQAQLSAVPERDTPTHEALQLGWRGPIKEWSVL